MKFSFELKIINEPCHVEEFALVVECKTTQHRQDNSEALELHTVL